MDKKDQYLIWKRTEAQCLQMISQAEEMKTINEEVLKLAQAKLKHLPAPKLKIKK